MSIYEKIQIVNIILSIVLLIIFIIIFTLIHKINKLKTPFCKEYDNTRALLIAFMILEIILMIPFLIFQISAIIYY